MFRKVLVANRGEVACRILRTLRRMGVASVAVYSDAERVARPVLEADEAVRLGPAPASQSYLDVAAIIAACHQTGADAVHPGYGFLSENPDFAEALAAAGICFIGPDPKTMRRFALKHAARALAEASGVPLLAGSGLLDNADEALSAASRIGYPVMLKSTAGGGGIGMQLCRDDASLAGRFAAVQRLATSSFGDGRVYLERYVAQARHVEVQIFGDGRDVVTLGSRDCSLQRRHQKVVEETPAPNLPDAVRRQLETSAGALGRAAGYRSAGTVEFIYDPEREALAFLEVNTRLQVEHGVTEAIFGVDLVEWMVREAAGEFVLPAQDALAARGCAIEARVYAENPVRDFAPSTGVLTVVDFPDDVRVDGWVRAGTEVSAWYDPLLAKVIATGTTRGDAIAALDTALSRSSVWGVETNIGYVRAALALDEFAGATMSTATLAGLDYRPPSLDVLAPGTQSSLQDWPGRLGLWDVGVPPSGPMDERSFKVANRLVGNTPGACALEMTLNGPTLRFNATATVALAGAMMAADLDGVAVAWLAPFEVAAGQVLRLGAIAGCGARAYLAVRHGFDAPVVLGSRATFALGGFGGHATGTLARGDTLRLGVAGAIGPPDPEAAAEAPLLAGAWTIGVLRGPHGAPDFFTEADAAALFASSYEVHFNSARTGVRLIGPKPDWARPDGGEAGLHPSNIHDTPYAVGAVDFTGDMPIILGPDGPSLGGFVCPAVVLLDELWKLGQLRAGNTVRFEARGLTEITGLAAEPGLPDGVLARRTDGDVDVCYRICGDDNILVEYGQPVLDLTLRLRVQVLLEAVRASGTPGLVDLTPGIRSLQIHYDPRVLPAPAVLALLQRLEAELPGIDDIEVPSRIVHLPLSWDDPQAALAARKYQELVRPDAPWCPSNIEFIRRINGLAGIKDVRQTLFDATYLVLGLGDVYLGAPVATPLDPRHRLVTTKYNPARTWTPENAVGIGGAYLCVYGMEGPGGYQLVGRTIQMWNRWEAGGETTAFEAGKPWLLRFFDQIRFYEIDGPGLVAAREGFPHGRFAVRIEPAVFRARDYAAFLADNAGSIAGFQSRREAAFASERARWQAAGLDRFVEDEAPAPDDGASDLPDGAVALEAPVPGSVWQVAVAEGDAVEEGQLMVVLESMKMEMRVTAPFGGRVLALSCAPGRVVRLGQRLALIGPGASDP